MARWGPHVIVAQGVRDIRRDHPLNVRTDAIGLRRITIVGRRRDVAGLRTKRRNEVLRDACRRIDEEELLDRLDVAKNVGGGGETVVLVLPHVEVLGRRQCPGDPGTGAHPLEPRRRGQ